MTPEPPAPAEHGYSLIEALIALAIIAAMTGALVETAANAARARGAVRERREAMLIAQSVLDNAFDPAAPESGSWRQYSWQVAREPYGSADPLDIHPLEQLTVVVRTRDTGGGLRLSTLRMRP